MNNLALAEMSVEELDELSSGIEYARSARFADRYTNAEDELWAELQTIFNRPQPIHHFVKGMDGGAGYGMQRFKACAQMLDGLIKKVCPVGTKKPVRHAMRKLLLNCLCNWLRGANVPLSPKVVLNNMEKLEHAVDQEYPGYIDAGILLYVLEPLPASS